MIYAIIREKNKEILNQLYCYKHENHSQIHWESTTKIYRLVVIFFSCCP